MKTRIVSALALVLSLNLSAAYTDALPGVQFERSESAEEGDGKRFVGERFARTELFFGTARPDGLPPVTEQDFQNFLDTKITPAFPDGLTLLTGLGQFRGANGIPIEEDSFLVILLYPVEARRARSEKIEQIRKAYKEEFRQESVLRSDFCCERVGF
jgi:hypothetical protein